MPDPTDMVLTGGFAVTFGLFALAAVRRLMSSVRPVPAVLPERMGEEEVSPYQSPHTGENAPPELPGGKVPVWFYRGGDLLGAAFVFLVFSGLVMSSFQNPPAPDADLDPVVLLINIGFQFVMAGIVALIVLRRVDLVSWLGLRWSSWPWLFLIAPGSVMFMWLVFGGLQWSGYVRWMESLGVETVQDTVKLLQQSDDPLILGLMGFAAVIAAPICEEMVFRGYFYPVLKKFSGVWPAAVCSALFFASAHGSLTALLPLFLFGGLLVFIYERTGSLWAPIAVHFCFNGATVAIQMAARYYNIPLDPIQ